MAFPCAIPPRLLFLLGLSLVAAGVLRAAPLPVEVADSRAALDGVGRLSVWLPADDGVGMIYTLERAAAPDGAGGWRAVQMRLGQSEAFRLFDPAPAQGSAEGARARERKEASDA